VSGPLTNVNLEVNGSSCSFTASGSAPATYTNATETLGINGGGLTISNVGSTWGILGTFSNGDAATLQVDYALPGTNLFAMTSPRSGSDHGGSTHLLGPLNQRRTARQENLRRIGQPNESASPLPQ
jgi:hypothetical protein